MGLLVINLAIICEVSKNKSLVKVDYQGTISEFLPYLSVANSFKRHFIPPRVGEQVLLIKCDNGNAKFALGSIFSRKFKEPSLCGDKKEVIEYEDGTILSYDTATSTLEIQNPKAININASNSLNLTAPNVKINGDLTVSGKITDAKGDLTNHKHNDTDGGTSLPR